MSATVTVSVRIPLKMIAAIRRAAAARHTKVAAYVRQASYECALRELAVKPTDGDRKVLAV
jgi:hypothetical protein